MSEGSVEAEAKMGATGVLGGDIYIPLMVYIRNATDGM